MKIDKKVLRRVTKILLNKTPKEEEKILKVLTDVELISTLYRKNTEFRNILLNPGIEFEVKKNIIEKILHSMNIDNVVKEAVIYLSKSGKVNVLKELDKAFKFEVEKLFATVQGQILSAYPLEEEEIKEIKNVVEDKIGKNVEFEVKQDPSLIGGIVVKAGSYVLNASIKFFIKKLEQQLTQV